jgi:predicted Zn-dependent protease
VRQGLVTASVTARGAAANSGLLAFDRETAAGFQFIAFRRDNNEAAGLSSGQSRSIDDLDAAGAARDAVERLRYLAKPLDFKDGRCTVILAPAAVAGLLAPLIASMESPPSRGSLGGRLGEVVVDRRLRLQNRPDHPDLLGRRFDDRGAPADFRSWIADGALRGTSVDSAAASEGEGETAAPDTDGQAAATATLQYPLDAAHFSASETTADSLEALIGATQHGILVSAVEHVRASGGAELPVSGRASAAFLIEEGGIVGGISAPAFRDGVLRAFNAIDAVTPAAGAVGPNGKVLAPAMRIRDFAFRA